MPYDYFEGYYESYEDDWADLETKGPKGSYADTGYLFSSYDGIWDWEEGWNEINGTLSSTDTIDYLKFSLAQADFVSFSVTSDVAATFTIYTLEFNNKKGVYSLKALQTSTISQTKTTKRWDDYNEEWEYIYPEYDYAVRTAPLALQAGDYYFSVSTSSRIQDVNEAEYKVNNVFSDSEEDEGEGILSIDGTLDRQTSLLYKRITISDYLLTTICVSSNDPALQFTLYSFVQDKNGKCSMKPLQTATTNTKSRSYDDEDDNSYRGKTKEFLIGPGKYYISLQSPNAAKGIATDYSVSLDEENTLYFNEEGNEEGIIFDLGWLDSDSPISYGSFTLDSIAKLSVSINADDAAKFTIYSLVKDNNGIWTMKSLQSTSLKKNKVTKYWDDDWEEWVYDEPDCAFSVSTKQLQLGPGNYIYSIESTNAKNKDGLEYELYANDNSVFYESIGELEEDFTFEGYVDQEYPVESGRFTLVTAAKLSFFLSAEEDSVKFSLSSLSQDKNGKYSLKSVFSGSLKKNKTTRYWDPDWEEWCYDEPEYNYSLSTKAFLLTAGEYYFTVEGVNAKKGKETDFSICLDEGSVFFNMGDNSDDWTDMKTRGAYSEEFQECEVNDSISDWVGFGDDIDYYRFTLDGAARVYFSVGASDAVKVTISELVKDKSGNYSLKNLLSVTAAKNKVYRYWDDFLEEWIYDDMDYLYSGESKGLLLTTNKTEYDEYAEEDYSYGEYFLSVQSTNASKGGNADYDIYLCADFFGPCNNNDDNWLAMWNSMVTEGSDEYDLGMLDWSISMEGWVGFGDTIDCRFFENNEDNLKVTISITSSDAVKVTLSKINGPDKNGKYSLKSVQSVTAAKTKTTKYWDDDWEEWVYDEPEYEYESTTKAFKISSGDYCLSVESTNATKGGSADYQVWIEVYDDYNYYARLDGKDLLLLDNGGTDIGLDIAGTTGSFEGENGSAFNDAIANLNGLSAEQGDVLAANCASGLADAFQIEENTAWQNIASLA